MENQGNNKKHIVTEGYEIFKIKSSFMEFKLVVIKSGSVVWKKIFNNFTCFILIRKVFVQRGK